MSYLNLVKKPVSKPVAIAIVAIPATDGQENRATIATIATIAVANTKKVTFLSENTLPKENDFLSTKNEKELRDWLAVIDSPPEEVESILNECRNIKGRTDGYLMAGREYLELLASGNLPYMRTDAPVHRDPAFIAFLKGHP